MHQSTLKMVEVNESLKQLKDSAAVLQYGMCVSSYELTFTLALWILAVT